MAQYNDRLTCIQNVGQNKNGNTGYVNLDSLYEGEGDKLGAVLLANNDQNTLTKFILNEDKSNNTFDDIIKVYPNPASSQIIISYNNESDGYFKLYNATGNIIVSTSLLKGNNKTQILLNQVANGIYNYEVEFGNKNKSFGKLTILK
jgi:hypothetical protein